MPQVRMHAINFTEDEKEIVDSVGSFARLVSVCWTSLPCVMKIITGANQLLF